MIRALLAFLLSANAIATAQDAKPVDAAAAFGARRSAGYVTLSPDGKSLAFLGPVSGTGTALYTYDFDSDAAPKVALYSDGKPERIEYCSWVANQRLACLIAQIVDDGQKLLPVTRWVALDRDGTALKLLSNPSNQYTNGYQLWGGTIIDFLPDQDGAILMARKYIPDTHTGSHIGSMLSGLGVDWIDTRTLQTRTVETPGDSVIAYLADGHGQVRVMGQEETKAAAGGLTGQIRYSYRKLDSKEWSPLAEYNRKDRSGFAPVDIDADTNTVFGGKILDGRNAIYSMTLDGTRTEKLISARPDVDVLGVVRGSRHRHIVGVYFQTDTFRTLYIDPAYQRIVSMLARALPQESSINIVDASDDGNKFLILTSGDDDPGHYYLFNRDSRQLRPLLAAYMALDGYHLSRTRTIGYTATDSAPISGYLTLPQGASKAKGLPAIVLLDSNDDTMSAGWIA
ncbi:MAG: S9 family peptidase, partial [Proteobacteria bacterium]|nr:S9 family peptidase [Pseudomonadota bacterium]